MNGKIKKQSKSPTKKIKNNFIGASLSIIFIEFISLKNKDTLLLFVEKLKYIRKFLKLQIKKIEKPKIKNIMLNINIPRSCLFLKVKKSFKNKNPRKKQMLNFKNIVKLITNPADIELKIRRNFLKKWNISPTSGGSKIKSFLKNLNTPKSKGENKKDEIKYFKEDDKKINMNIEKVLSENSVSFKKPSKKPSTNGDKQTKNIKNKLNPKIRTHIDLGQFLWRNIFFASNFALFTPDIILYTS